jgi:hypothetical protein
MAFSSLIRKSHSEICNLFERGQAEDCERALFDARSCLQNARAALHAPADIDLAETWLAVAEACLREAGVP